MSSARGKKRAASSARRTALFPIHPVQASFLDSRAVFRGFVGGRGAGKSFIGAYDLICRAKPDRLYMVCAPTYPMMTASSLRSFISIARQIDVLHKMNRSSMTAFLKNGAEVMFRSTEDPERLRGPNLSGVWMDEASLMQQEAYNISIACLREGGEQGWLSATFTPKGKQHWTYDIFGKGKPVDGVELFHCKTTENPFLPENFHKTVGSQYTTRTQEQELGGQFLDAAGKMFQRHWFKIVRDYPRGIPLLRYWDFAASSGGGCYTVGVLMGRDESGRFFVVDVVRGQWGPGERNAVVLATAIRDGESVSIWFEQEPGSAGVDAAEYTVRLLAGYSVHAHKPSGDKAVRAEPYAAQCEAGNVSLVEADWNREYLDELESFPDGKFMDQTDGSSGCFNRIMSGVVDWSFGASDGRESGGGIFDAGPIGVFGGGTPW